MRKTSLLEMLDMQPASVVPSDPNLGIVFDNMVSEWGGTRYAQLAVVLVHLNFLTYVHHTHHWLSKGDVFYGDHLLFQRLYLATQEQVDGIGERVVGLGGEDGVNLPLQVAQLNKLVKGYGMTTTIPQPSELARRSLLAEQNFLAVMKLAAQQLDEQGMLTRGLDNLMQGIEDLHESHVYLLKQRCKATA